MATAMTESPRSAFGSSTQRVDTQPEMEKKDSSSSFSSFPAVSPSSSSSSSSSSLLSALPSPTSISTTKKQTASQAEVDAEQERLMAEECILVDKQDKVLGHASKKECHLMKNINKGMLHRAFSVFLFNSKGELLLQQRSAEKITFPLRWTNTCCSHPLYMTSELDEKDHTGVKVAAIRKLQHELGITGIDIKNVHYLTRILYKADSDGSDWGEHEVDHILFIQQDVDLKVNSNEVAAVQWITADELAKLFQKKDRKEVFITPWFHMIADKFLYGWWKTLSTVISNKGIGTEEAKKIYELRLE
jgi:isopentenyl-diphosphate delta-isomerase